MGENGIHDANMRENGVVNGGNSTPNVPGDVRGRGSGRSGSDVVKGGQGLGDSFWIFGGKVECGGECCVEDGEKLGRKLPR